MNRNPATCDDRHLLEILEHEPSGSASEELLRHVENCPACQRRLEELAADPTDWHQAGQALSDESWNDEASDAPFPLRSEGCPDPPVAWTESLAKQLLSPPSHPEMLGRLGRYEVERMIGAGGMGVVFKAFDSELNRPVAVKVLAPYLAGSGSARKRFAREARAAAAIVHEHVVPIHNVETERDAPFLVMQYIAGESLQARLDRAGPLNVCEVLRIGRQIAAGLAAAHQQGLVHRDIKPSNILLEVGVERALITDFGLARAVDDATLTRSGFHPGTPQFMSPEQASGEPVDARSDLFSLGSVLYTMCTGRAPFRAETTLAVLRRITDDEPRRIRELNPQIPDWLCQIIERLMSKRPGDRYPSAADVVELLDQCLAHVQQPDFHELPAELLPGTPKRSKSLPFGLLRKMACTPLLRLLGAIALCAGLAAYFLLPSSNPALSELQGEWQLVALEREGTSVANLYNGRLVIEGTQFTKHQTAPDGREIRGESGRLVLAPGNRPNAIDVRLWEGTGHGLYQLNGDDLILCMTRNGGPRPTAFRTRPGDDQVLETYRRKRAPLAAVDRPEARSAWRAAWVTKVSAGITRSMNRDAARRWLREQGFQNIQSSDITLEVMQRLDPKATPESLRRDSIRTYVSGQLSFAPDDPAPELDVYCLFDASDALVALNMGPRVVVAQVQPPSAPSIPGKAADPLLPSRARALFTRPVLAENAPILACLGPDHPLRLGDTISYAELTEGIEPEVVRLHVWDWSKSDLSRVLLIQRSELGALSPDGTHMLTQEGETIDLTTKQTRQYSGFQVPEGQRITALHLSPARNFVLATIHERTDTETIPTDPPTLNTRHFWSLRLLHLDPQTNRGRRIGEFPADARAGVVFAADESSFVYSTEQHSIVRRDLQSGKILNTYEPALGVHGGVGVALSSDGRLVAAAGYHGTLSLWDARTGTLLRQLEAVRPDGERDLFFRADVLRFSPDNRMLVLVSNNHVKIVDVATGNIVRQHHDPSRPRYIQAQWSPEGRTITLLTSSQVSEYSAMPLYNGPIVPTAGPTAERLPRIYEWTWETGAPVVREYVGDTVPPGPIDPDLEARRFTGTWRIVDRRTAGVQQQGEIGQTVSIRHLRMGETRLIVNPNQTPPTVDIVFLEGPETGKVLRGIYEWIPDWKSPERGTAGPRVALRICTFLRPDSENPDRRPPGFEAGPDVDTAVWECLSHDPPVPVAAPRPKTGTQELIRPDPAKADKPDKPETPGDDPAEPPQ